MKDDLGKRMKENYEERAKQFLPRRTFTIIRLDGKAFQTFTRGLDKPFDNHLIALMNSTMKYLVYEIQGAVFGYTQSDEISIVMTDFAKDTTDAWFDGNVQKIVSVAASMATFNFASAIIQSDGKNKFMSEDIFKTFAFDARLFIIPDRIEVMNYFIWRQKDAMRNSVHMVANSLYSHKELHGKSQANMKEMIIDKDQNWETLSISLQRGRGITKEPYTDFLTIGSGLPQRIERQRWTVDNNIPIFKVGKDEYLDKILPNLETL